jgi:hypothetical protein
MGWTTCNSILLCCVVILLLRPHAFVVASLWSFAQATPQNPPGQPPTPGQAGGGGGTSRPSLLGVVESDVDAATGRTSVFTLLGGETVVKNDGQYALCSANGLVWHDLNADGLLDEDKLHYSLANVPVYLYWHNGSLAKASTTAKDGTYSFKVEPGEYYIVVQCPTGYKLSRTYEGAHTKVDPTLGKTQLFGITASKATTGLNAACYRPPAILGTVFNDINANSVQDPPGEKGIPEIEIELAKGSDTSVRLKAWTDGNGRFSFLDLEPGDYTLHFITPPEYHHSPLSGTKDSIIVTATTSPTSTATATSTSASAHDKTTEPSSEKGTEKDSTTSKIRHRAVTLTATAPVILKNTGMKQVSVYMSLNSGERATVAQGLYKLSVVEGTVFEDVNADGVWNKGERILPGVQVNLWRTPNTLVNKMPSDENGHYRFIDLEPGSYFVSFDVASPDYKHSKRKS